jgi:hypothetical protein
VQVLLNFGAICFKFHDHINQLPINFQNVIPETVQGDKRFCESWWSTKLCLNSNKRHWSTQGTYFRSHARSVNQRVKISKGLPIDAPYIFYYFQHARHHVQKARGSRSTLHTTSITFSPCVIVYKKQGAPDRCSIRLLLLSARALPHTKNKGLPRYVLQI